MDCMMKQNILEHTEQQHLVHNLLTLLYILEGISSNTLFSDCLSIHEPRAEKV
jgi:hypothetical protein